MAPSDRARARSTEWRARIRSQSCLVRQGVYSCTATVIAASSLRTRLQLVHFFLPLAQLGYLTPGFVALHQALQGLRGPELDGVDLMPEAARSVDRKSYC